MLVKEVVFVLRLVRSLLPVSLIVLTFPTQMSLMCHFASVVYVAKFLCCAADGNSLLISILDCC